MQGKMEAEGKINLGKLPWDLSERLTQIRCNWLEFVPGENALVISKQLPAGCPAVTGIPCEVITLLDSVPPEARGAIPGGAFHIKDCDGRIMRLIVEKGEVRIQWPVADYSEGVPVPLEAVLSASAGKQLRATGWVRFAGARKNQPAIESFVARFGGTYPEGDMPSECDQSLASIRFSDRSLEAGPFVESLRSMAHPAESLCGEIDFHSAVTDAVDRQFRLVISDGKIEACRPALWTRLPG